MMLRTVFHLPRLLLIGLVRVYQYVVAPHLPKTCRYTPSCSVYAVEALEKYGAVKGTILTVHRLSRCHPFGGHGYDPPRWYGEVRMEDRNGQWSIANGQLSIVNEEADRDS